MKKKFSINKFFFKISIFFILGLVVFFLLPFIINLNAYKNKLEVEFSSILNSQVKIDGAVEYSITLGPRIIVDTIVIENDSEESLTGNINTVEISINPIDILTQTFNLKKIKFINGSLSLPINFVDGLINGKNNKFNNLQFENLDIKIFNNRSDFQLDGNSGSLITENNQLVASEVYGSLGTFGYKLRYKDNLINFSIPQIKLETEYQIKSNQMKNAFLQIKSANKLFFPGFENIYLRTEVYNEKEKFMFKDIKLTSSVYNGIGWIEFITNPNLSINANLTFGRTNFSTISKSAIATFFQNTLLDIASMFNASFKISFKHILMEQNYFENLYLDVQFLEGDIIVNNFELVSKNNNLQFSGRIVDENKDKLFFFNTKFRTNQLKKLCTKICKNDAIKDNYSMVAEGTYNIKKAKVTLDDFFSHKKYNKQELISLSNDINKTILGNFENSLELKNYLGLY